MAIDLEKMKAMRAEHQVLAEYSYGLPGGQGL